MAGADYLVLLERHGYEGWGCWGHSPGKAAKGPAPKGMSYACGRARKEVRGGVGLGWDACAGC